MIAVQFRLPFWAVYFLPLKPIEIEPLPPITRAERDDEYPQKRGGKSQTAL